ncbi:hypothetical protein [Nocardioides aurantiacus]|uniref:Uncharacterized protein n=1 Tax=Nocardioides aurantiacus TaxID=86796 RepID=A0A3N2CW71_9ACTN|nr:hypothetical protein [Nocardioides aurantiacus]ROR91780.1 hypothetical protein EDD33_2655 [Nocardioides aurantiacus]
MPIQRTSAKVAFRRPWPGTRRGLKLWLLSIVIGLLGFNYIVSPVPTSTEQALTLPGEVMPLEWWGIGIVGLCVVAGFCSYCHMGRDRYGYYMLSVFAVAWGTAYLVSPFLFDASTRAFSGALSWYVIFGFLVLSAGDE